MKTGYLKMVAPRALVFRPLVNGNVDSGNEIALLRYSMTITISPLVA